MTAGGRRRRRGKGGAPDEGEAGAPKERAGDPSGASGSSESTGGRHGAEIPRWVPPVAYAALTLFLFRKFVFSDRMLYGSDTLGLGYMARAFFAETLRTTGFPVWNPVLLGGTPFLESLAGGDSLYPPSLLLLVVMETYRALGWKLVLHVFLAGCFMHAWLRMLGVSRAASLVGGVAYLLTPTLVTLVFPGNDGKLMVTALAPLLFWAVEWVFRRRDLVPLAAEGAIVALVILTTQFQMAYFLFGAAGTYAVFRAVQEGAARGGPAVKRLALFVLFSVLGAGAAGVQLIPSVAYVLEHSRRTMTTVAAEEGAGVEYSSSWSLHPEEAVALVVPEFVGNSAADADWAQGTYWGRNPVKLNHEYLGLVALLLAVLSLSGTGWRGIRWFLLGLGGTALLFALGTHTPVWRVAYELLPGISLFRAPSMAVFLTAFAVSTLAALGVERGLEITARGETGRVVRPLLVAGGLVALGLVLAASGALLQAWTAVIHPGLTEEGLQALGRAAPFITRGFFVATLFSAVTLGVWWAYGRRFLNGAGLVFLLALLVAADEIRVDRAFVRTLDPGAFLTADPNVRFLQARAEEEPPFRVFSMVQGGQDVIPGMHGLDLAGGHHPNDLARYRELIGMEGSGIPEHLALFHPNVMRILNVRYVLWPDAQYDILEGAEPVSRTVLADGSPLVSVYPYPGLPRVRVVGEAIVVPEDRTLAVILGEDEVTYDPARQTVLVEPPPIEVGGPDVRGTATWVDRTPNRLVLDVEASGPALLVLSENWYPSWRASVDGEPARVLRADHTLRAVAVPQGAHRVELWYESPLLRASAGVSVISTLLLATLAGMSGLRARRRDGPRGHGA